MLKKSAEPSSGAVVAPLVMVRIALLLPLVVTADSMTVATDRPFEFCALESCGKCTPCRIGSVRGAETMQRVIDGEEITANLALIADLCETLKFGSLCALGGFTPYPVMSAINHWPEDFRREKA